MSVKPKTNKMIRFLINGTGVEFEHQYYTGSTKINGRWYGQKEIIKAIQTAHKTDDVCFIARTNF